MKPQPEARATNDDSRISGWRRLAVFNITLLGVFTVVFLGFVVAAAVRLGGMSGPIMFYTGDCKAGNGAWRVSFSLHLLINIAASCVLASSNFFMQVLNAPSRAEIDRLHARGKSLEIGYPSWTNTFRMSWAKTAALAVLLLSSLPIHLLFNSAIFQTDYRERFFHLTIASEGFVNGAQFFPPGASLTAPDGDDPANAENTTYAAANAARWTKLEPAACNEIYTTCRGLTEYGHVVVIVDGFDGSSAGWARDQVWMLSANESAGWDEVIPPAESNSMWFAASCKMADSLGGTLTCENNCAAALGTKAVESTTYQPPDTWTIDFFRGRLVQGELKGDQGPLLVKYCLAEPLGESCSVGFSNKILLIVTVCVLVKTITCLVIFILLRHTKPLVTLGDAIESFIVQPDRQTRDLGFYTATTGSGYFSDQGVRVEDPDLPPDSILALRFSTGPMLLVALISAILLIFLALILYRKLPSSMPIVGGNSAAISAACHVSPLSKVSPELDAKRTSDYIVTEGTSLEHDGFLEHGGLTLRSDMSQSLMKWGILQMPKEWYDSHQPVDDGVELAHLSFGDISNDVKPPEGRTYLFR
ncbi:hypothetical protein SLS62_002888 [Diatrype stigma]|uniref:DUF6536 domain-containing protein n=1 Tax=Diatrype stigma TaxID=117547 RepID=A0AAN9YQC2_9PEZI